VISSAGSANGTATAVTGATAPVLYVTSAVKVKVAPSTRAPSSVTRAEILISMWFAVPSTTPRRTFVKVNMSVVLDGSLKMTVSTSALLSVVVTNELDQFPAVAGTTAGVGPTAGRVTVATMLATSSSGTTSVSVYRSTEPTAATNGAVESVDDATMFTVDNSKHSRLTVGVQFTSTPKPTPHGWHALQVTDVSSVKVPPDVAIEPTQAVQLTPLARENDPGEHAAHVLSVVGLHASTTSKLAPHGWHDVHDSFCKSVKAPPDAAVEPTHAVHVTSLSSANVPAEHGVQVRSDELVHEVATSREAPHGVQGEQD
jgi:hypothetical protein